MLTHERHDLRFEQYAKLCVSDLQYVEICGNQYPKKMTQDGMRLGQFSSTRLLKNKTCLICRQKNKCEKVSLATLLWLVVCVQDVSSTRIPAPSALGATRVQVLAGGKSETENIHTHHLMLSNNRKLYDQCSWTLRVKLRFYPFRTRPGHMCWITYGH